MAYTFLKALGHHIGTSLVEDDQLDYAKKIYGSGKIVLPVDNVVAAAYPEDESATGKVVNSDEIPDGMMGLDIGPKTAENYAKSLLLQRLSSGMDLWESAKFLHLLMEPSLSAKLPLKTKVPSP